MVVDIVFVHMNKYLYHLLQHLLITTLMLHLHTYTQKLHPLIEIICLVSVYINLGRHLCGMRGGVKENQPLHTYPKGWVDGWMYLHICNVCAATLPLSHARDIGICVWAIYMGITVLLCDEGGLCNISF